MILLSKMDEIYHQPFLDKLSNTWSYLRGSSIKSINKLNDLGILLEVANEQKIREKNNMNKK